MKKILLIEDNDEMRENTSEILELASYEVKTAKNGKEGVDFAQKNKFDLIICDVMMPVLDGYGVLHLLSKNPETASVPFIFITAKGERSDLRKGMEMGADDYLTKPFEDVELLKAVESRLKKNELLKDEFSKAATDLYNFIEDAKGIDELKQISASKRVHAYNKKEVVYSEGSFPSGIYMVNKGKIKCFKTNPDGKEFIVNLYKDGDYFGYTDLLEDSPYKESAAAIEPSEIVVIPKDDFFSLLHKNKEVSKKFIKMLANDLAEKEEQLLKLAYNSVRKRIAEALLMLISKYKESKDETFKMSISRDDIASIAGTSTETAIRTLSDFKDEKIIEIKGSTISIINEEKLNKMKN